MFHANVSLAYLAVFLLPPFQFSFPPPIQISFNHFLHLDRFLSPFLSIILLFDHFLVRQRTSIWLCPLVGLLDGWSVKYSFDDPYGASCWPTRPCFFHVSILPVSYLTIFLHLPFFVLFLFYHISFHFPFFPHLIQ